MSKRIADQINSFKYKGEPIRITLGTLVMTALCVILLIVATFTQITVQHPYIPSDFLYFLGQEHTEAEIIRHFVKSYDYIPQIPMIFSVTSAEIPSAKTSGKSKSQYLNFVKIKRL